MKLSEAILMIKKDANDSMICARTPWVPDADCIVIPMPDDYRVPDEIKSSGYKYFLEKSIIKEFKTDFSNKTDSEFVEFVIFYAENDAFPD